MTVTLPTKHLVAAIFGFVVVAIYAAIMIFEPASLHMIYEYKGSLLSWSIWALAFMSFVNLLGWFFAVKITPWLKKLADTSLAHAVCHDEPELLDHLGIQDPPEQPKKEEGSWYCHACQTSGGKHQNWCPIWD
jgi:hypothetical protein